MVAKDGLEGGVVGPNLYCLRYSNYVDMKLGIYSNRAVEYSKYSNIAV